ncbi:MAG: lycopene cyclase family protein [Ginsengibacter sp.]
MTDNDPYGSFDFIFLGAGCASLSLLMRMIESGKFSDKKILVIDRQIKNSNDRTWCFWEKEKGYFDQLVFKTWTDLLFIADSEQIKLDVGSYVYKMIRGIDFYEHCFSKISTQKNITVCYGNIEFSNDQRHIIFNGKLLHTSTGIVFNSIVSSTRDTKYHHLLQHFKGWIIEAGNAFDPGHATLMDFSVDQQNGTTFIYVLPLSPSRALVEYTLFSPSLLTDTDYDNALKIYIENNLKIKNYSISATEFGVIPMTNQLFPFYSNGMYHIGTAGGNTKPSTGYTFRFIQKQSCNILKDLIDGKRPTQKALSKKFNFYDSTFLNVLATNKLPGKQIFTTLFKKNKASEIFLFLDNESTFTTDISIINSLPTGKFLKAGLQEMLR